MTTSSTPRRTWHAPLVLAAAAAMLLAACNGGGGDDDASASTTSTTASTTTTSEATTTTTQPPGTDFAAVEPLILDLLRRSDELVVQLRSDPSRVNDSDDDLVHRYRDLFTSDSPHPDDYFGRLGSLATAGTASRPGPSGVLQRTTLDTLIPPADQPDSVSFQFCGYTDYQTYNVATGQVVSEGTSIVVGGGEARRVNGVWLLYDFPASAQTSSDHPPGAPNTCELEPGQ